MHRILATAPTSPDWDAEKSLTHVEAAVKLLEGEPDSAEKAFSYSGLAWALLRMLDLRRALENSKKALEIAEHLQDSDQVAYACTEVAVVYAHLGELSQAHEYAERSWKAAQEGKDSWAKSRAAVWPLVNWPWSNDKEWLEKWLDRYLEYRRRSQVERYDIHMYSLSALLAALVGRPQEAAEGLLRVEEFAAEFPYLHPYALHLLGAPYAVLGDWERASRLMSKGLAAAENARFTLVVVQACMHYGRFLLTSGDTSKAEEVLIRGYTLANEKGSVLEELNLLPLLCELQVKTGRLEQAEQSLKQARELLARPQPWRGLVAGVCLAAGILATARQSWSEAETAFEKAREAERTYGFPYGEACVLVEWGEMYLKRNDAGDRERGIRLLDQTLEIFQRLQARKMIEKVLARKDGLRSSSKATRKVSRSGDSKDP
jgi:tetratricopeptide (TPR) repeat protein